MRPLRPGAALAIGLAWAPAALGADRQSEPAELVFEDAFDPFEDVQWSSGPLPAGSPVTVSFEVRSLGEAVLDMQAVSTLAWPSTELVWRAEEAVDNLFEVVAELKVAAVLNVDVWDIRWRNDLVERTVEVRVSQTFDGLLLPGDVPERMAFTERGTGGARLFDEQFGLVLGATLGFSAAVEPELTTRIEGLHVEVGDQVADFADPELVVAPPANGVFAVAPAWNGTVDHTLAVVLSPVVELCAPVLGCWPWEVTTLDYELATDARAWRIPSDGVAHPLPGLVLDVDAWDAGEVPLELSNVLRLDLENSGVLPLEGELAIDGSPAFDVFPDTFAALEGDIDGVVVFFTPLTAGDHAAELVVTSNDPLAPERRIPLSGVGFDPAVDLPDDTGGGAFDDGDDEQPTNGCTCASTGASGRAPVGGGLAGLAVLGGLVLARRRAARAR